MKLPIEVLGEIGSHVQIIEIDGILIGFELDHHFIQFVTVGRIFTIHPVVVLLALDIILHPLHKGIRFTLHFVLLFGIVAVNILHIDDIGLRNFLNVGIESLVHSY